MERILIIISLFITINSMAQQKVIQSESYNYLLYIPETEAPEDGYPLMLFLHGAGERGNDLDLVKKWGPPSFLDVKPDFPFIVISPQCPPDDHWNPFFLGEILDTAVLKYDIDTSRIYVTGLSMGGSGTWNMAMSRPDRIAAIAPICGRGLTANACAIKDMPVWVFHGAKDDVVPSYFSGDMVEALRECGNLNVRYTLYPEEDHFSWIPAYEDPELYEWLLKQSKK